MNNVSNRRERSPSLITLSIIGFIASKSGSVVCGADIITGLKLRSGTVYPILARLDRSGILACKKEVGDAASLQRPLRLNYVLTKAGKSYAEKNNLIQISATIASLPAVKSFNVHYGDEE